MTSSTTSRPGGRSAKVRDAVYTAVGQLMGEGTASITVPAVAQRAGVNPTSVYRRWGDIDTLLEEVAVAALTREGDQPPDTGSLVGDLTQWAQIIVDDVTRPHRTRYLRAMVSARSGEVEACPCWEQRRGQSRTIIERAQDRGELVPTVDQVLDHLIAPIYHHVVFGLSADHAYADRLVRDVVALSAR
ncbi:TetR/AcrR family transcriptional regulator [Luteipulveratus halotolerans]|uniref:TetR family transcriptional regulator n=1 Tax=Luteipulveratus halotolerans TaxID=1631356 RepID=A0A0L6CJH1_9MICO|nr:TetR/AcrR family transcriptional regulator [Luteipulveratus halotolerans]KNX37884.1 TetR family transcriptional regulator [Luteipulveratus halotolerans]